MAKLIFKTRPSVNGNIFRLEIDLENRTYEYGYHLSPYKDATTVTKTDIYFFIYQCKQAHFEEIK